MHLKMSVCVAVMVNFSLNREHLIMEDYLKIEKIGEGECLFLFSPTAVVYLFIFSVVHISVARKVQVSHLSNFHLILYFTGMDIFIFLQYHSTYQLFGKENSTLHTLNMFIKIFVMYLFMC